MIDTETQGAVDVLTPRAALNGESQEALAQKVAAAAPGAAPQIVINLAETPLVDSAGLEALLDARGEVRRRGGALKIAAPQPLVRDVLHATGVDTYFEAYNDVRSAVGSYSR